MLAVEEVEGCVFQATHFGDDEGRMRWEWWVGVEIGDKELKVLLLKRFQPKSHFL